MLVGRKTERARIDALLAGAREGRGGALVLRGEPGIGKSALLADARSRAADMRVLHAHGVQAEAVLVYSGLHELLRPVADRLDALPDLRADAVRGALGLGPGQSTPLLVGAGTLSLLVAAAEERPLLCLVDDAHWLDAASAGALTFAARRLEDDPVAVLFAAREGESRAFAAGGIPEFALAGLESEDAAEMLRGRGVEGKVAVELQRVAVGNPLALLELPRALSEAQRRGEGELPQPLAVTEALQAAFAGRIERLPAATRLVLLVAAAESSGRLGPIERACAIVGADAGALAAAEDAHLVGVARDRLRLQWLGFMAEVDPPRAVAGLLDEARRTGVDAVHAASAGAVAASIASRAGDARSAVEASRLIAGAGAPDDPFRSLTEAIGALSGGLVDYSEALTGPALELAQWEEWRRERPEDWLPMFTVSLGIETLLMLGEHEVVRDRAESALARVDPADLLLWTVAGFYLGVAELYGGRWAGARARLGEMVRMGAEVERPRHVRFAHAQLAQLAGAQGHEPGARAHAAAAAPVAGVAGVAAGAGLGLLALGRGEYDRAAACYERDVLDRVGPCLLRHDVADANESYVRVGRAADAANWLARFDEQARRAGWPWALARAAHLRGLLGEDDAFTDALRHHDRARQPFLRARTELALGERLRRTGQRRAARDPLQNALGTFEGLEAAPWAQRAAAELRATGERVRRRNDLDTSRLTAQELQVALVVARGATNREAAAQLFLSSKTIEKHLGAVDSKLGVRSRTELARLFAEQASAPALV